jgi:PKD repeat protein
VFGISPSSSRTSVLARVVAAATAAAAAAALAIGVGAFTSPAAADTAPAAGIPSTVSADGLPTWQINGVVWSQAVVGNTVYVAGNFTKARPAGVAVGGVGEVNATYAFAYDITTGNRIASFNPTLDAQANVVMASPDGKTVYFGGDFSVVNGFARAHIAAFDTTTNQLVTTFAPTITSRVAALAVTGSTVYAGGTFLNANATARNYLAAFNRADGSLLPWAPVADQSVTALVMAPDSSRVIVGGHFLTLNGTSAYGMGSLDASTAATLPWAANTKLRDAGTNGAITTLRTDGTNILGGGYSFGSGAQWEGLFAADPATGNIVYANDCHGDTYDVFPMGQAVYTASHVHTCEWIGSYKNTQPFTNHFATAYTNYATTTNTGPDDYGWNISGTPAGGVLDWFPTLTPGTFTGQNQAGWSLAGNSTYVSYGGEFTNVNGVAQQGLVRFAVSASAPNKVGATFSSLQAPGVQSLASGAVRISWPAGVDRDNTTLSYKLYRDSGTTPIYTTTADSTFFAVPGMSYVDTGLAPGSTHTYYVRVTDPFNNAQNGPVSAAVTVAAGGPNAYVSDVLADGATHYWRLDETAGAQLVDWAGTTPLYAGTTVARGAAGAIIGDADGAVSVDGTSTGMASNMFGQLQDAPSVFSVEAWIKTTTTSGGDIVGFGNLQSGNSGSSTADRRLYMDNAGHLVFGVIGGNGTKYTAVSSGTYNDGTYHHVAGAFSASGLSLFVDGRRVAVNRGTSTAKAYQGYWRIGQDTTSGWSPAPSSSAFIGTIDDVAVYSSTLTPKQISKHYVDSGRTLSTSPITDAYGLAVTAQSPDLYWRLDETSGTIAADSSGNGRDGVYAGTFTLNQPSNVSGSTGASVKMNGSSGNVGSVDSQTAPTTFTESGWFTTTGNNNTQGQIIGFGSAATGNSSTRDRVIGLVSGGTVTFTVNNGGVPTTISSPTKYNNGAWHQAVATQDASGMKLYVDGTLVASNSVTTADSYTGYWRGGGDTRFLNGKLDEVAVWSSKALTANQIRAIYTASPAAVALGNQAPTATIATPSCIAATCTFDGSGSSDPDGLVASYAWNFGDSTTGTGVAPSHTYTASGTYTVTLTVTDNNGAASAPVSVPVTVIVPANVPPTAAIGTPSCTNLACTFSGAGSADSDGTVASYAWDFGDGTTGTGVAPAHTFTADGTYTVSLVVTDNQGATSTAATTSVTVAANKVPVAAIGTPSCTYLACTFSGAGSTDSDGTVASYAWDFGDGTTGTGVAPAHTYTADGTYTVSLVVTDNQGATSVAATKSVTVKANVAPTAAIGTPSCTNLACSFSGAGSTDSDGTIASYAWNFGDSTTGTGVTASHTYADSGTYTVSLVVTDNAGLSSVAATTSVTVTKPATNQPPTATIATPACLSLTCTFDGSASTDTDGTIASYAWTFGDGTTGTGAKPSHTYAAKGTYTVTLTVTDNQGAASTPATTSVTVASLFAVDTFTRTVASGWGTADLGGAWTASPASAFATTGSAGTLTISAPSTGPAIYLNGVSSTSSDTYVTVTTDKPATGNGVYANVIGRRLTTVGDYRAKVRLQSTGAVGVTLTYVTSAGAETTLKAEANVAGLTYTAGTKLRIRVQVTGTAPTTIQAKVWVAGTTEPTAWATTITDSTAAMQAAGGLGLAAYLSGSATNAPIVETWDDFQSGPVG